ncbi:MAG: gliding motility lipoprotein GldH [Prevotella sp.]|uniref:gliding motility lipoprotein GldH n=1 Tax=Prevotella sp. TaxID=59823 RepID=UPI002A25F6AC|nr:gliding motility lipoprotein GldH [Prevotella sp.]MDD7317183.1 gliding motility lipoprotein GldH [Prevotellaceae bacterium]MDY4019786.1 gliding motility lipoprotein GldH [Prevotella sp.]
MTFISGMKIRLRCFSLILSSLLLVACETDTVYHHFEHTRIVGWERNDTLTFAVPAVPSDGNYREELTLRVNNDYPFMGLTLIVEQTVFPGKRHFCDTLNCRVTDKEGNNRGRGIAFYEYDYPLKQLALHAGDSLQVRVRHYMKREIVPGIADVGIRIRKK